MYKNRKILIKSWKNFNKLANSMTNSWSLFQSTARKTLNLKKTLLKNLVKISNMFENVFLFQSFLLQHLSFLVLDCLSELVKELLNLLSIKTNKICRQALSRDGLLLKTFLCKLPLSFCLNLLSILLFPFSRAWTFICLHYKREMARYFWPNDHSLFLPIHCQ